jgi:predicted ATP-dependent endonuclease of OLD family
VYLSALKVINFKSLEMTEIPDIGSIDVIAGKNNSGKSSILEAITIASASFMTYNFVIELSDKYFSGEDRTKQVSISLVFDVSEDERRLWLDALTPNKQNIELILKTPFMKKLEYVFDLCNAKDMAQNTFGLVTVKTMTIDRQMTEILTRTADNTFNITQLNSGSIGLDNLSINKFPSIGKFNIGSNFQESFEKNPSLFFIVALRHWMSNIYYFSAFRQSTRVLDAVTTPDLANNGSNLVQRIFTIKQNEDRNWKSIQKFVELTLPDIGELQSRVDNERKTRTVFVDKKWGMEIDIHDMGSGIEQLIMIACVLISKCKASLIMIESPEHHLHPGAQRVLLEFLRQNLKNNQIIVTTHSTVFLAQKDLTLHLVTKTTDGTKVQKVEELEDLSLVLSELGSKNSDLLLADKVLFVEGDSDERILKIWANKLGLDFESNNVLCLHIHGSRNLDYYANSEVLDRISKLKIPSFFIIDHDEKSEDTIRKIKSKITSLFVLERREIENYLITSHWILNVLKIRAKERVGSEEVQALQPNDIKKEIQKSADELKSFVLIKRVKTEIGGGSFLTDDFINDLIKQTKDIDPQVITEKICKAINDVLNEKCSQEKVSQIVDKQLSEINDLWNKGLEDISKITPGEEIVAKIFEHYGFKFNKLKDGPLIAEQANVEDIPPEIVGIIKKLGLKSKE